ncbi:MAG: SGNH/GDSL hydrolase family protein [Pseudomonadales bacterium]
MEPAIRSKAATARNLLLVAISTALTLASVEILMRLTLDPSDLYSSFHNRPDLNQWRNEVQFWERYHDAPSADFGSYDPLLGWDNLSGGDRIRGGLEELDTTGLRILAVGDSFVWGNEVAADETFSSVLNARFSDLQVLNMGVPGYGIDQAYLKYLHYGSPLAPDVILFGVYVSDYERASVAFSTYSKPRFKAIGDQFVLENQPVAAPDLELDRIGAALEGRWYLVEFIHNAWRRLATGADQDRRFFDQTDRIIAHILGSLQRSLSPDQKLLVVHIPRGESFTETEPFFDEMHRSLLAIYASLGLDYIDLFQAYRVRLSAAEAAARYYVQRPSGSVGHLSAAGHARVAELIAEHLGIDAR